MTAKFENLCGRPGTSSPLFDVREFYSDDGPTHLLSSSSRNTHSAIRVYRWFQVPEHVLEPCNCLAVNNSDPRYATSTAASPVTANRPLLSAWIWMLRVIFASACRFQNVRIHVLRYFAYMSLSPFDWLDISGSQYDSEPCNPFLTGENIPTQIEFLSAQIDGLKSLVESDREDRMRQQQLQIDRQVKIELTLLHLLNEKKKGEESLEVAKSSWTCPVCRASLKNMRSFKGHIKRLNAPTDAHHHCCLKEVNSRHINLVSACKGETFTMRSKEFASMLWLHVQSLTSSDESPGIDDTTGLGRVANVYGAGAAPESL